MLLILDTPHLILRALHDDDAVQISELINNERISSNLARVKFPYTLDDAHNWLASLKNVGRDSHDFAVTLGEQLIGVIGIEKDQYADSAELGYWLAEPWWGKGYMGKAAAAVLAHGFINAGYERMTSGYRHGNEASRRILDRLGFRHAGHRELFSAARRGMMAVASVEITRREWLQRNKNERGDARC